MKPAAAGGVPYRVPPEPSRWPAIALAAAMHAGLVLFLYIGISWQNTQPVAVEAEVWDMKTQAAAPPPPPPEAAEAAPPPPPAPAPKVVAPPVEQPVTPKPPDIALEREKHKAEKRRQQDEEQAKRLEQKLAQEKQAKELKAKQLAEQKADELAEKKAQALAEKKAQELAEKKLATEKLKADKLAKAKEATEQKKLDQLRADEMRRITGGAGVGGEAAKATAPRLDTGYLASITSKIKNTTSYAGDTDVSGNPRVLFKIEELPTGEIISVKKIKSSGVPAFDDAVEKGIIKSSPLPKKKDGTVERTLEVAFSMKDLN